MALKLDRNHNDYLFWIFPLIILGLLFFAIKRDNLRRESDASFQAGSKADSSITMSVQKRVPITSKTTNVNDSTLIYYSTTWDD
ncbi:MAG TPA: hypothetical protein DCZ51_15095 [Bacteroidales bacterium]|nr:hypothetical protein [Bacteroidales bacterium]